MLHPFVSVRVLRVNQLGAIAISVVTHSGLIAMAASPGGDPASRHGATDRGAVVEYVRFTKMPPAVAARRAARSSSRSAVADRAIQRAVRSLRITDLAPIVLPDITPAVADIDFTGRVSDSLDFVGKSLSETFGPIISSRNLVTKNGAYSADAVDRVVMPLYTNPAPAYPRSMAIAGIEADFVVYFVVDSTGRVDSKTLEIPTAAHPMFADAVRRALGRSRYRPAEMGGRRVRQLVQQAFAFRMAR